MATAYIKQPESVRKPDTATLPIPRATLEEMERNRARAVSLYADAFDALEEARVLGARAACSASGALCIDEDSREALAPKYRDGPADMRRDAFVTAMTKQTDRAMWGHIIQSTDLERLMDHKAARDFRDALQKAPPPATSDNVRATLERFMEDADTIFRRGIAIAFSSLDRRFRSHDGFKIGSRIILTGAFGEYGMGYNDRRDTLRDIERTFCVLDGKPQPEYAAGIGGLVANLRGQGEVEGDYFKVRRFHNGNAHLWFTRPDLTRKVNRLLADYYGEAIGEGSDVADVSDMGPSYHLTPAKNFGLFESPAAVVDAVFERATVRPGMTVLEPSAGRGRLANEARKRGGLVQCVEIQHGLAAELRRDGHSVREGDFLAMTPADLGTFDLVVMNPPFDRGRDCDHVRHALQFVKPGGRLVSVMSASASVSETKRAATFRAMLDKLHPPGRWGDQRWSDLPAGSFRDSGTMVNTCVLAVSPRPRSTTQEQAS